MKKMTKKLLMVGLCAISMTGAAVPVMAQTQNAAVRQQVAQDLRVGVSQVSYSNLIKGDGVVNFNVNLPAGVKLATTDPYKFSDCLTQNYDLSISEGVHYSKDNFSINVNWANQGVSYKGDWVFNIDGKAFTDGVNRSFTIKVINDLQAGTPVVYTNVDQGVTVRQLTQGFDLVMDIQNARFNTTCFGNYIRMSMMNTCGIRGLYPVAYCNSLKPNQVKMRVQAPNGVESWRTHFEFKLEGNATNSSVPITVRIPIIR